MPIFSHWAKKKLHFLSRSVLWPESRQNCVCGDGCASDLAGELTALRQSPSQLGRGYPSPKPIPLGPFGASTTCLRRATNPLNLALLQNPIILG